MFLKIVSKINITKHIFSYFQNFQLAIEYILLILYFKYIIQKIIPNIYSISKNNNFKILFSFYFCIIKMSNEKNIEMCPYFVTISMTIFSKSYF